MSEAAPATKFIPYRPHHGGQRQFHDARSKRRRFMACGARFGKDRALVNETLRVVTTMAKLRLQSGNIYSLVPLVHAWVVAPGHEAFVREALTEQIHKNVEHDLESLRVEYDDLDAKHGRVTEQRDAYAAILGVKP